MDHVFGIQGESDSADVCVYALSAAQFLSSDEQSLPAGSRIIDGGEGWADELAVSDDLV